VRVYIAGPCSATGFNSVEEHIAQARAAMVEVYRRGHTPFCPHTMAAGLEGDLEREVFLRTDLEWLRLCEAVLMLPGWHRSPGSVAELQEAERLGLGVYYRVEDLPD